MLGAITSDIIGSWYEFRNHKSKSFEPLFHGEAKFTDDTVCTVAIADALVNNLDPVVALQTWDRSHCDNGGWGQCFNLWLSEDDPQPYNSWGSGTAMTVTHARMSFQCSCVALTRPSQVPKTGVTSLIALCRALLRKSVRDGLVVVGEVKLRCTIELMFNSLWMTDQDRRAQSRSVC